MLYGGLARTLWALDYPFGWTEPEWRKVIEEEARAWARVVRWGKATEVPGTDFVSAHSRRSARFGL